MSALKKGLGRGFDSLIPTELLDETFQSAGVSSRAGDLQEIPLVDVHANPDQPRRTFDQDSLDELAASIKEHGVLQPIIVAPADSGYQIVAGERRYRAAKQAGLTSIPAIIRGFDDQRKLEVSLVENIQRRDLNSIETAAAYAALRDQFNLTSDEIAARVHKSVPAVVNTMRLLRLPKEVILAIAEGKLTEGHARPLIGQDDEVVLAIVPRIIAEGWTSRQVEQYVVNLKRLKNKRLKPLSQPIESQHQERIASLKQRLHTDVDIRVNTKGAGKIVITFKSSKDLERIQKLLGE